MSELQWLASAYHIILLSAMLGAILAYEKSASWPFNLVLMPVGGLIGAIAGGLIAACMLSIRVLFGW